MTDSKTGKKVSKKKILLGLLGLIVVVVGGGALWILGPALLPPEPIDVGIKIDAAAPVAMELKGANGEPTSLAQEMGENGMVLFLVRSADWCPFCKAQMVRTEDIREAVTAKGYALAALSYDKPEVLAAFIADEGLGYTFLSDEGSEMINALGLADPQYEPGSFAYGVPRASILYLAPYGTVQAKYVAADYRSRPSNEDVLAMLNSAAK